MIKGLETKIVVVGGGPSGLYCAYLIKKNNPKLLVTLLEAKSETIASCCSGHVSIKGINDLKLSSLIDLEKLTVNRIRGAKIYSPNNEKLEFRTKQFQTIVINRNIFDKELENLAKNIGVEILYNHQVVFVDEDYLKANIVNENKTINLDYNYLIGADGPNSIVRKTFFKPLDDSKFIATYQVIANGEFQKDMVSVYFDSFANQFFSWIIPLTNEKAKIGIGTTTEYNPNSCFNNFLQKLDLKLTNINFDCSGIIPISKPLENYVFENKLLIGDAAYFVKATSGGGLVFGLKSAEIAAETITNRFKNFKNINNFNKNLKKEISDLKLHFKIHSYIFSKTPDEIDVLFKKLKNSDIEAFLNRFGNIDYPSKIIPNVIFNPKFLSVYKEFIEFIKL